MAKGKGKGKGGAQPKRIKLYSVVKVLPDKFSITVTAITRDDKMEIAGGQQVTMYNDLQRVIKSKTKSDLKGRVRLEFDLPLDKTGENIPIRAELDGTNFNDEHSISLPDLSKGKKVKLTAGEIMEVNGEFHVVLEVETVKPNGMPDKNVEVDLYVNKNEHIGTLITEKDGKTRVRYHFSLKYSEKKLDFRAQIKGMAIEGSESVQIPAAKYSGWSGGWQLAKLNLKKKKPWKFFGKLGLMYLGSIAVIWILETFGLRYTGVPIAMIIMFAIAILPGRFTLKLGAQYGGVFLLITLLFPELTTGALGNAAKLFLLMGPLTYAWEELTHKEGEPNNVYPWFMLNVCKFASVFYLIYAVWIISWGHSDFLLAVKNYLEADWLQSTTKTLMTKTVFAYPKSQHIFAFGWKIGDVASELLKALSWIMAMVIIFTPASFGEVKRHLTQRKKGEKPEGITAGKFLILDLLMEVIIANLAKIVHKGD